MAQDTVESKWVNREIEVWLEHGGSPAHLFLIRVDGVDLSWDEERNDWESPEVIPSALRGLFSSEQKYIDLAGASRGVERTAVAPVFAAVRDRSIESLLLEEAARARRRQRTITSVAAAIAVLLVLALIGGGVAIHQTGIARKELRDRVSASLAAQALNLRNDDPRLAALSALAGYNLVPNMRGMLALSAVAEANAPVEMAVQGHSSAVDRVAEVGSVDGTDGLFLVATHSAGPTIMLRDIDTLGVVDSKDLPADVTLLGGFRSIEKRFVFAKTDDDWYALEASDTRLDAPKKLQTPPGIAREHVIWSGRMATAFLPHFVVVTDAGRVFGWGNDLKLRIFPSVKLAGETFRATAAGPDLGFGARLLLAAPSSRRADDSDPGELTDIVAYSFGDRVDASGTERVGTVRLPRVTAITGASVLALGTVNGTALLDRDSLAIRSFPAGGVAGLVRGVSGVGAYGSYDDALLVRTDTGTALVEQTDQTASATVGEVATAGVAAGDGYVLGHPDGRVSLVAARGDLRRVTTRSGSRTIFAPEGAVLTTTPATFWTSGVGHVSDTYAEGLSEATAAQLTADQPLPSTKYALRMGGEATPARVVDLAVGKRYAAVVGILRAGESGVFIWRRDGKQIAGFTEPGLDLTSVLLSPDERQLALLDSSGSFLSVDSASGRVLRRLDVGPGAELGGFSATGAARVFTSAYHGRQRGIVTVETTGTQPGTFQQLQGEARTFAVSPDATTYAVATGKVLRVVDITTGIVRAERELSRTVEQTWWSPKGDQLAVRLRDTGIALLGSADLAPVQPTLRMTESEGSYSVSWWDPSLADGGSPGFPHSTIAVSSASDDGRVSQRSQVFDVGVVPWAKRMCTIAGSSLSPQEWSTNIGDIEPFTDLCAGVDTSSQRIPYRSPEPEPSTSSTSDSPPSTVTASPSSSQECRPPVEQIRKQHGHPELVIVSAECSNDDPKWTKIEIRISYNSNSDDVRFGAMYFKRDGSTWKQAHDDLGLHGSGICDMYRERKDLPPDFRADLKDGCAG